MANKQLEGRARTKTSGADDLGKSYFFTGFIGIEREIIC